ncbi:HEAT repeat domain-containing protein [Novipirellula sp.]|uniref:HEAT repeat domain-containing protein n=1 Tax=Novipirellula sp. TaxID=2795430 RepID=UPI0035646C2A
MQSGDPNDLPNPFALHLNGSVKRSGKSGSGGHAFKTSLKFFLIVAVLFGGTLAVGRYSKQWIVSHLMRGFEDLGVAEKQQRLVQISELGSPAIGLMVRALNDESAEVARTAYELLRESQNSWTSLEWDAARQHHHTMVTSMDSIAASLPEDRTGWTTGLLQQTIMESVQKDDSESKSLYNLATTTLSKMSLTEGAVPGVIDNDPLVPGQPVRLAVRSKPLPVADADALDTWTDWPLAKPAIISSGGSGQNDPANTSSNSGNAPATVSNPSDGEPSASVYRSSATLLKPVSPNEAIDLKDVHDAAAQSQSIAASSSPGSSASPSAVGDPVGTAVGEVMPTSYLTQSPLETYATESVIYWLASDEAVLRDRAKSELIRRGFSQAQLQIATHVVSADVGSRLELVDTISRSNIDDPRPWLTMLLNDDNREVRLRTISVIATMKDAAMNQKLRSRLADERDPIVTSKIRSALQLR